MKVYDYESVLKCPECGTEVLVHNDKLHPTGKLDCYDCEEELEIKGS